MSLTHEEINLLLSETGELFIGKRAGKIYHIEPDEVYITFRVDRAKVFLFLSTRPQVSRFHPVWEPPPFPPVPGSLCEQLRGCFSGKVLRSCEKIAGNRAVQFRFASCRYILVGEFFGSRGNVIVLDNRNVAFSLHPVRCGEATLSPGDRYVIPAPPSVSLSRQHPRYLHRDAEAAFPFSDAFARHMKEREEELDVSLRCERLKTLLRKKRKRSRRLLQKLRSEKENADNAETVRRRGEALKCCFHRLKGGERSITTDDPYAPGQTLDIPLDPARSPAENLARYFKQYKKLVNSRDIVEKRYRECSGEDAALSDALAMLEDLSRRRGEDRAMLEALEEKWGGARRGEKRKKKGPRTTASRGPKHFLLRDHQMWVGKNSRSNAALFREYARGNDYFLHIAGKPGAVVILRPPSGKALSQEVLLDAAVLCVYYSLGREAGSQDVDYTQVKYVKPLPRREGRFLLQRRKTLRVAVDGDRLFSIKHHMSEAT